MALLEKHPPKVLFHAVILVGCVAMLLGVAGIFYFGVPGRDVPQTESSLESAVLLLGLSSDAGVEVEAAWAGADGTPRSELGRRGLEPMTWRFLRAPEGVALTVTVYRNERGVRTQLQRQPAVLTRGAGFQVSVPDAVR